MCAVAAGITYNLVYTFWYYDLEVAWWQNMQTYFYDVNSSISTSQLSDRYALEWNQLIHYYKCCGIETFVDFQASSKWKRIVLNGSQQVIPLWCCQMSSAASFPMGIPSDPYCYVLPSTSNSYIGNLCPAALLDGVSSTTWRVIVDLVTAFVPALCIANLYMVLTRLRYELCTERKTAEDEWIFQWGDSDDEDENENSNESARGGRRKNRGNWWRRGRGKRITDSAESNANDYGDEREAGAYGRWRNSGPYLGPTVPDPNYVEPVEAQAYVPPPYEQSNV